MENSVPLSLWFGAAFYAAIGLFGVVVFHELAPLGQQTTEGYGIGYAAVPQPPSLRNNLLRPTLRSPSPRIGITTEAQ